MTLKLGMLGMHHPHAHGLVQRIGEHADEFALVAAFDPDRDLAENRAEQWATAAPDLKLCERPEDVLAAPLEGVIVEGLVKDNLRWARLALEQGLPVMLEKPAGMDGGEHRRVAQLARSRGLHLQMIYLFRFMSAVQEMLQLARGGALGRIYEFRARLPKDSRLYERHEREYARFPGGIFFEMAGHLIDIMVAILGRPQNVSSFLAHHAQAPGSFIDNGLAVFEFDAAWAVVEVSALEPTPDSRRVEVYGDRGAAVIPHLGSGHLENSPTQPIEVYRDGEPGWQIQELPAAVLQIADLREFAACLEGKPPDFSLDHDLLVQETLLRACRAWGSS